MKSIHSWSNMSWPKLSSKQISHIRKKIYEWEIQNFRSFPWREETNPFHAIIAEILLQRTRAEQVVPVYLKFKKTFPDARTLSSTDIQIIGDVIKPLGLKWRASILKEAGKHLEKKYDGIPPDNYKELIQIPGVGPYVASAFLSLHRGIRYSIIDSNIIRLYTRLFGFNYNPDLRRKKDFQEFCETITPENKFRLFNYGLIDFTRSICKSKPRCKTCMFSGICQYTKK